MIFDLEKDKTIKAYQPVSSGVTSVVFTKDCLRAYICDEDGALTSMDVRSYENPRQDFKVVKKYEQIGSYATKHICLTNCETNLLIGSRYYLRVFNIEKSKIIKEFKMGDYIVEMKLINDG